ncbi:MAG: hypothetical protein IJT12_03920 [Paludibacteraceae bacterium]|nr:hypothetical protein [Paludibacteraceae bacterium]
MKKITSSLLVAFALLMSVSVHAKQYCHEALTQGDNTIYLTCELLGSTYKMTIEADVELAGLGGSFMTLSDGNHDLREFMTKGADGKSLVITFTSATDPNFYTPLYVMMPGEVNFGELKDIEWGLCTTDETEYTITVIQPASGGTIAASEAKAKYGTEVVLTATPDAGKQLDKWIVTDAEDNAVSVSKGKFNMPTSNVTVTATFKDEEHLTPATWSGKDVQEVATFTWSVTRNVDYTLSFAISWDKDLEGVNPQININNGAFRGMQAQGKSATYTTTDEYEDGAKLPFFFYIAYTGAAARIDVDYTVGASNADMTGLTIPYMQPPGRKVILNGVLYIEKDGVLYTTQGIQF